MNTVDAPRLKGLMMVVTRTDGPYDERVLLGLLESVEADSGKTQRGLSAELGIAVGLVNAYMNRCIQKGLVKVTQAPARRFAYYLTPNGFAEKSRLSLSYLSHSLSFFRRAKSDCMVAFETARARGFSRIALAGVSDIAEIATICARESGLDIVVVVDGLSDADRFVGLPVVRDFAAAEAGVDAVIVTGLNATRETIAAAEARFGAQRVLVPSLLRKASGGREAAS